MSSRISNNKIMHTYMIEALILMVTATEEDSLGLAWISGQLRVRETPGCLTGEQTKRAAHGSGP
jgi:hypothetical protein